MVLCVLLLQFVSRYLPSPRAVFVADDWTNYARSTLYGSTREAVRVGLQDPNRPLSTAAVAVAYRLFGSNPLPWTLISVAANSLMLWFIMLMGLELTGRRRAAALQGVLFALLPNLFETWHWSTQVVNEVTCGLLFYALSGWLFTACVNRGGALRLAVSALAYAVALFSYEQGILLPAAFLVLLPWRRAPWRSVLLMVPFGLVFLLYAAWRTTNAFGFNQSWFYPAHMQAGFSWWFAGWNLRQLAQWWIGDRFFGALLDGWHSFSTLAPWTRRLLVLVDLAVVAAGVWAWRRGAGDPAPAPQQEFRHPARVFAFGLVWAGVAMATSLASYTASRLNVLPAMGLTLLAALALVRLPWRCWLAALFVPAVLCLAANQGRAETYRQVGAFQVRLFEHLREHEALWRDKEVLLLDTKQLRQRLTSGLVDPIDPPEAWLMKHESRMFLRGFIPFGMVQMIRAEIVPSLNVLLDVECGIRLEGDDMVWHIRNEPAAERRTPLDRVFTVDAWEAGRPPPAP